MYPGKVGGRKKAETVDGVLVGAFLPFFYQGRKVGKNNKDPVKKGKNKMATSNKNLLRMIKEYCARTQCDCCIFDDEGQCELMEVPSHWNVEGITRDIESELEKEPLF